MYSNHQTSHIASLPELDLFGVPPTQLQIDGDVQTEHRPISTITDCMSPISFEIHSALDEYINIGKSELYLCIRVSLSKTNIAKDPDIKAADWKTVSPINYLMNSMFKQISVAIGPTTVTTSSVNYAYVAYMDALINYSSDAKNTHLQSSFWHRDNTGEMDKIHDVRSARIRPTGNNLAEGCELEMYGALHLDLCTQMKSLLGGITLKITLYPNDPKFYLMYDKLLVPKVEFRDVRVYIHRSKIAQQVIVGHNKALEQVNSLYFINRKEVKSFIVQKGTIDGYLNNVENGILPRRIYVALVSNEAFNGTGDLNPFNFKNYSLRTIACYVDGRPYPQRPYAPDFNAKKYIREYFGLFETANQLKYNPNLDITRDEFNDGFTIFGFNFSPDLADDCNKSGYISQLRSGNLRIELKFNHPLIETVSAIIFCEYDNIIEIPASRVPIKDFN